MKKYILLSLRPTQFALGMLEVERKIKKYSKLSKKELHKKLKQDYVILAKGPDKKLYIIDRHHHVCVFLELGIKKIYGKIAMDFSKDNLTFEQFWDEMAKNHCCHLHDQFGEGPRDPMYLPRDIMGLGDDPYRSLAWIIKEKGYFEDVSDPHADFEWANFFRSRKLIPEDFKRHFKQATKAAEKLAKSPASRHLPGRQKTRQ